MVSSVTDLLTREVYRPLDRSLLCPTFTSYYSAEFLSENADAVCKIVQRAWAHRYASLVTLLSRLDRIFPDAKSLLAERVIGPLLLSDEGPEEDFHITDLRLMAIEEAALRALKTRFVRGCSEGDVTVIKNGIKIGLKESVVTSSSALHVVATKGAFSLYEKLLDFPFSERFLAETLFKDLEELLKKEQIKIVIKMITVGLFGSAEGDQEEALILILDGMSWRTKGSQMTKMNTLLSHLMEVVQEKFHPLVFNHVLADKIARMAQEGKWDLIPFFLKHMDFNPDKDVQASLKRAVAQASSEGQTKLADAINEFVMA